VDECKPLPHANLPHRARHVHGVFNVRRLHEAEQQGLTLVHVLAQRKPFLTQNTPWIPPNTPEYSLIPAKHPLQYPSMRPLSHRKRSH
jgi:hypothetical protein